MLDDIDYTVNNTNLSPKVHQNLRHMFQEQAALTKSLSDLEQKSQEQHSLDQKDHQTELYDLKNLPEKAKEEEKHVHLNIQQKADFVTEEVFKLLFNELGKGTTILVITYSFKKSSQSLGKSI